MATIEAFRKSLENLINDFIEKATHKLDEGNNRDESTEPPEERAIALEDLFWSVFDQVWEIDPVAWVVEVYTDDKGRFFAVVASNGKLFRMDIQIDGNEVVLSQEWAEIPFEPGEQARQFKIRQMEDGRYRWIGISSSSVLNRNAEIDSRALFDSFIDYAEETGEYPIRQFYHLGESFKTGRADFLAREGNLYITSGIYDDSELARREIKARLAEPDFWGDSIGFWITESPEKLRVVDGLEIDVYNRGINYEISTLPEQHAASWMTNFTNIQEVKRQMNEKQLETLRDKLFEGDNEAADAFIENLGEINLTIRDAKMITRNADESETDEAEVEKESEDEADTEQINTDEESEPEELEIELDEVMVQTIVDRVSESLSDQIRELQQAADALRSELQTALDAQKAWNVRNSRRIDHLERDDQEVIQQIRNDMPRNRTLRVGMYIPREQNKPDGDQPKNFGAIAEETLASMNN